MQTRKLGSSTWMLTHFKTVNMYLVSEPAGYTLIDTSMSGAAKGILNVATTLQATIRRIVLTHSHADHAGSVDALAALLPGVALHWSAREARLMAGDRSLEPGEAQVRIPGSFVAVKSAPAQLLSEGDRIGSLEAIAAPGHTPGQMAFLNHEEGTLIAADDFTAFGGLRVVSDGPWYFPFAKWPTWHAPTALASARKLAALRPARIAVGHGPALDPAAPALMSALEHAEARSSVATDAESPRLL
jgi:glyoxylase-like metal-dependent hydrolase (beta-lactamase superfamily II)